MIRELLRRCAARLRACRSELGATATEYALVIALVILAAVLGIKGLEVGLDTWFGNEQDSVDCWDEPHNPDCN